VLVGGSPGEGAGYFYAPTVLKDVPPGARMFREEIFGPVAPVFTFSDDDQGVAMANDTEFGLVSYVFTNDLSRALTVSEKMETGMVGVNQGVGVQPGGAVRRHEGQRVRTRGRHRRNRRISRDEIRRSQAIRLIAFRIRPGSVAVGPRLISRRGHTTDVWEK
jgi:acyl-CoA reductase-like NAD-dependent aldehyde dehydrogenase